jgi:hypothetical protein
MTPNPYIALPIDLLNGDLLNPRAADRYGITVRDTDGNVWHQIGSSGAPVELGGGNVSIKE